MAKAVGHLLNVEMSPREISIVMFDEAINETNTDRPNLCSPTHSDLSLEPDDVTASRRCYASYTGSLSVSVFGSKSVV